MGTQNRPLLRAFGRPYRDSNSYPLLSIPNIMPDGATAMGGHVGFCPQNDAIFGREIRLERIPDHSDTRLS
jgi:hypothetical protein